jgi:UDPglucose--hexose-1-phosphate uridylyltransferase
VIIEGPDHRTPFPDLPHDLQVAVLGAYRDRLASARRGGFPFALVFANRGRGAGATQDHPHSQLVAMDRIPERVARESEAARRHHVTTGVCMLCALLAAEKRDGRRVIEDDGMFLALAPFVSRHAYETWILPAAHPVPFENAGPELLSGLARALSRHLGRLAHAAGDPPYNLILAGHPEGSEAGLWHWRLELLPRLAGIGGFEWGTGGVLLTLAPEEAAGRLRQRPGRVRGAPGGGNPPPSPAGDGT